MAFSLLKLPETIEGREGVGTSESDCRLYVCNEWCDPVVASIQ